MQSYSKILTALLLMGIILTGCGGAAGQPTQQATLLPPIEASLSISAEGQVVPLQSANLTFTISGVVSEILVQEGEAVARGQIIARLGGSERQKSAVKAAELELINAEQALKDLQENAALEKAQAQLHLAEAEKKLDDAVKRRASKDFTWGDRELIDIAYANYILAQNHVDAMEDAFSMLADRPADDVDRAAALSVLAAARQQRDRALANYNYLTSKPDKLELNQAEGSLAVAQAEVESAKRDFQAVENGPDPEKLAVAKARLENARAQLDSAKAGLAELELAAPFAGVIVSNDLKVGEQTGPAASSPVVLADISRWKIMTTDLTERDVIDIHPGDPVSVTFDAIPELTIPGKVERIKPLGENRQGDITYTVMITLDSLDDRLRWNMTSFVTFES